MDSAQRGDASPFLPPEGILRAFAADSFCPLLAPSNWQQMVSIAEQLPLPTHTVCFECRLGNEHQQADFALAIFPFHAAAAERTLSHLAGTHPGWQRFCHFLVDWGSPASQLQVKIPFVCVAFDLADDFSTLPAPCLSFCVDPDFFARRLGFIAPDAQPHRGEVVALAARCYSMLTGAPLSSATIERLRGCVDAGPYVEVKHLSFMLSRAEAPLKLNVRLPLERLADFIRACEWPADAAGVEREVQAFAPWATNVQLNLLIHPVTNAPLEVEVFPAAASIGARDQFLERIVSSGLGTVEQTAVLRRVWADPLRQTSDGREIASAAYVKLRLTEARVRDVKAYLGLIPRRRRAEVAAQAS